MKTAICILTSDGWTPIIVLGEGDVTPIVVEDHDVFDYEEEDVTPSLSFEIGETVSVNGRLYQGTAVIVRFDGEGILARAGNGKLYRYNMVDLINGVISKATSTSDDSVEATSDDFEVGDEVTANGNLYQGYGTVERIDGTDVLVRADNGKLYRYHPADLEAGLLSKS